MLELLVECKRPREAMEVVGFVEEDRVQTDGKLANLIYQVEQVRKGARLEKGPDSKRKEKNALHNIKRLLLEVGESGELDTGREKGKGRWGVECILA
eukprot:6767182-Pyramimonas_sp.AAC.1